MEPGGGNGVRTVMATSTELRVHVVVLWEGDVVHTALLARGQTFVLGDERGGWACPASALQGARSHVLVRVEQHGAHFTPPGSSPTWLACGRHASVKLERLSIFASAGVVDRQVQRFRTRRWDTRFVATAALTALAHAALLTLAALSPPPLDATPVGEGEPELGHLALVAVGSFAEPELEEPEPDIALEPSQWLTSIDGWARCGDELEMGTPTLLAGGRFGNAGPYDNADPHLAAENGPARPALEVLTHLPPARPNSTDPLPAVHRDPYALTAPWGRETPLGTDPTSARANLLGDTLTESAGDGFDGKRNASGGRAKLLRVAEAEPGARRLPPRVVHTGLRVSGSLASARVAYSMLARLPAFRTCYANSLTDASQPGRLELTLTIAPGGSVTSGRAEHARSVAQTAVSCMLQATRALRFDQAPTETTVTYPLLLIPPAPIT